MFFLYGEETSTTAIENNKKNYSFTGMGHEPNGRGLIPLRDKIFLFSIESRPALVPTQSSIQ
jgi:hypothetical protein